MSIKHLTAPTLTLTLLWALMMPTHLWAGGLAHEHGAVDVNLFIDITTVSVQLRSPLANFVGFEHSPRTQEERQKTDELIAMLNMPQTLLNIDPAGGCQYRRTVTSAKILGDKKTPPAKPQDAHADLHATLEYKCSSAARIQYVNFPLINQFKGVERIRVQVVTPKAQGGQTLAKPSQRVTIPR